MNAPLTVWGNGTSRTVRVVWMLLELGLDYTHHKIGSRTGETQVTDYLSLNPKGKIPTLQHGSRVITESPAIINYLTRQFPVPENVFVPSDAFEQARLEEWTSFIVCELDANSLYLIRRHEGLPQIYGEAPVAVASAREYFLKQLNAVSTQIEQAGEYLMGAKLSSADILLMSCLDWGLMVNIELPPVLSRYRERALTRPAYRDAMALNYAHLKDRIDQLPLPLQASFR